MNTDGDTNKWTEIEIRSNKRRWPGMLSRNITGGFERVVVESRARKQNTRVAQERTQQGNIARGSKVREGIKLVRGPPSDYEGGRAR